MAFTKLTDDLEIISKLSDEPNDSDGLTAEQLKAKFDEAGNTIKTYINNTLIDELEDEGGAANIGISGDDTPEFEGYTNVQQILELLLAMAKTAVAGQLADHSVENDKLSRKIDANGAAVKAENIVAGGVGTTELDDGAVTTAKLGAGAVTGAKTDFSAGLTLNGALVLTSGVHYFASAADLPEPGTAGRIAFVKV